MAAQDWHGLKKIGMHTLNNGGAILSFILLTLLTRWGISGGTLRTILDDVEGVVLIVLVLIFALNVMYDALPEQLRSVCDALLERLRNVLTSNLVFA
jgi:hypothetical protein